MLTLLDDLDAFRQEHRRYCALDGGVKEAVMKINDPELKSGKGAVDGAT